MKTYLHKIKFLEIEITSRCNARCSVCPRFDQGQLNQNFRAVDISLDVIQNNINWADIELAVLKGTVGDAGSHPELDKIIKHIVDCGVRVSLHTNGSTRSPEWWADLATYCGPMLTTRFCLDGIDAATHQQYRQTQFDRVLANAQSYIAAGGSACWFFIMFGHNQHQVEQAKTMAQELGFDSFVAGYSDRYNDDATTLAPTNFTQGIVWSNTENAEDLYSLKVSSEPKRITRCPKLASHSAYIAADGMVWPCCFYGSSNLTKHDGFFKIYQSKVLDNDPARMNINYANLDEISKDSAWQWWDNYVTIRNPSKCQQYCS